MGFLDSMKGILNRSLKNGDAKKLINGVVDAAQAIGKGTNRSEKFKFTKLPTSLDELKALPEAKLDTAYKAAALTMAALCNFSKDPEATFAMLDFLKGPEDVSEKEKQFIKDRLQDKEYLVFSYFEGATTANNYKPSEPFTIKVSENPYSFDNENWATLYVESSGADSPRPIKLRKKPSTGEWFLNDIQCLSDIRVPDEKNPWA